MNSTHLLFSYIPIRSLDYFTLNTNRTSFKKIFKNFYFEHVEDSIFESDRFKNELSHLSDSVCVLGTNSLLFSQQQRPGAKRESKYFSIEYHGDNPEWTGDKFNVKFMNWPDIGIPTVDRYILGKYDPVDIICSTKLMYLGFKKDLSTFSKIDLTDKRTREVSKMTSLLNKQKDFNFRAPKQLTTISDGLFYISDESGLLVYVNYDRVKKMADPNLSLLPIHDAVQAYYLHDSNNIIMAEGSNEFLVVKSIKDIEDTDPSHDILHVHRKLVSHVHIILTGVTGSMEELNDSAVTCMAKDRLLVAIAVSNNTTGQNSVLLSNDGCRASLTLKGAKGGPCFDLQINWWERINVLDFSTQIQNIIMIRPISNVQLVLCTEAVVIHLFYHAVDLRKTGRVFVNKSVTTPGSDIYGSIKLLKEHKMFDKENNQSDLILFYGWGILKLFKIGF